MKEDLLDISSDYMLSILILGFSIGRSMELRPETPDLRQCEI